MVNHIGIRSRPWLNKSNYVRRNNCSRSSINTATYMLEFQLVSFDHSGRAVRLLLKQSVVLKAVQKSQSTAKGTKQEPDFQPEFGSLMVEAIPSEPRRMIQSCLENDEAVLSMPEFPRIGAPGIYTEPALPNDGVVLQSQFMPDGLLSDYERYGTIHDNMLHRRRKRPVRVKVPIFKDTKTPWPWRESRQFPHKNEAQ
ncbi:hypothetical protein PV11_02597 [Exophiala sideris]|uniref:Glutamate--cysteine ligase n=1 Tax=Exophiala sideris TaxID=1016849 RepID=A0A0D1WE53_9EURO|nr:hypothetical protein PV11_02597 [Exophiala sideris]